MISENLKYMLTGLLLCSLMMTYFQAPAQKKLPNIQAIGKITLKNGQTEEGVIALGYSYDNKHFHPNAFLYETAADKQLILLDLDFSGLHMVLLEAKGAGTLFYAESKSDQSQSSYKMTGDADRKVLNKKMLREENFLLKKEFSFYPEIPLSLNVGAKATGTDNVKSFKVDEIERFELLRNPPGHWLQKLAQARARLTKKMEADKKRSNLWLEYQEPVWYHEIVQDNLTFSKWRYYFK